MTDGLRKIYATTLFLIQTDIISLFKFVCYMIHFYISSTIICFLDIVA